MNELEETDFRGVVAHRDAVLATRLARLLVNCGVNASVVTSAEDLRRAGSQGPLCCLICDASLPGARTDALLSATPLGVAANRRVALLPEPSFELAIRALRSNFHDAFAEPIEDGEFLDRMRALIGCPETCNSEIPRTIDPLPGSHRAGRVSTIEFLDTALSNVQQNLHDMRSMWSAALQNCTADACQLLNCPRPARLVQAVQETIRVLEHTKGAFRSKELGKLRRQLEILMADDPIAKIGITD